MAQQQTVSAILATNLSRLMEEKSLTQVALATKTGIGQTTISLYLNPERRQEGTSGKPPSPKLEIVQVLAEALGVELWELLRPLSDAERAMYKSVDALVLGQARAVASKVPAPSPAPAAKKARGRRATKLAQ